MSKLICAKCGQIHPFCPSVASACSSRDGVTADGNSSVQAGRVLKQFRKIVEQRISEWEQPDPSPFNIGGYAVAWGKRMGYERILLDLDIAIAKAEGELPTMGNSARPA